MIAKQLNQIYQLLFDAFGPQHWWPGQTRVEIITGAILTQNTNWTNVEKALANLKNQNLLDPVKLHNLSTEALARLIRPAGYFNIKAKRLKNFLAWLTRTCDADLAMLDDVPTDLLRPQLLAIKGIGPETADSILLYALDRPVFVIDAYTARILVRHHLIDADADYHQIQSLFHSNLPEDARLFNEYHALLVRLGKNFCKPNPKCPTCPLNALPHSIESQYP